MMTTKASVQLKARAKINLTLDVLSRRENGYHDVEMIMQQINLFDVVTVEISENKGIHLSCSDSFLPVDDKNIAFKAAQLMINKYDLHMGFNIHIDKNIPIAAGLAGGSTNAAAVIKGINELCDLNLSIEAQQAVGFELGADVPFCFMEGCAIARGLGEELKAIRGFEHAWMVLVKPSFGVSTKDVYTNLHLEEIIEHPNTEKMIHALETQNKFEVYSEMKNVLEIVTLKLHPKVAEIKTTLSGYGAEGVLMSGSGPTVFGFFSTYERAKTAHKKLKMLYPQSYVISTYNGS